MKLNFIKVNPTENMTIFVLDPLPRSSYPDVANKLMNYNNLHAEQVGFIEQPTLAGSCARLHMMGGEFCGNASRAFAAVMVQKGYSAFERRNDRYIVPIEVSGYEEVLSTEVAELTDHTFDVKIKIPPYQSAAPFETHYNGIHYLGLLVDFEGITQVILFSGSDLPDEGLLRHIVEERAPLSNSAFGVMFYDEEENFMTPLVYVEGTKSVVWERSCGTGTAALGVALSLNSQAGVEMDVNQPGGVIKVITSVKNGQIEEIHLQGNVSIVAEGEVYL
jgi:histidine racemase